MSDENRSNVATPVPVQKPTLLAPERLSDLVPTFAPFVDRYFDQQLRETESQERIAVRSADLEEKEITIAAQQWRWIFALAAIAGILLFALAAGLIFILHQTEAGILVLSHVAAIVAGAVGGAGFIRNRERRSTGADEG